MVILALDELRIIDVNVTFTVAAGWRPHRLHGCRPPKVSPLPARVREVLLLIAQELSDDDIAGRLGIGRDTVRNHVSVIHNRLQIRKRSAVIAWTRERGLGASAKSRRTAREKRPTTTA